MLSPSQRNFLLLLAAFWVRSIAVGAATTTTGLIDASGALRVQSIAEGSDASSIVAVVTSPGSPSYLLPEEAQETIGDNNQCLWLSQSADDDDSTSPCLICRGATLSATSDAERISLSTCSLVASSLVLGGITLGDVQAGIRDSRHGRTLTALFRARVSLDENDEEATIKKQTIILPLPSDDEDEEDASIDLDGLKSEIQALFVDVSIEKDGAPSFDDMYQVEFVSSADAGKIMMTASEAAKSTAANAAPLASVLVNAHGRVKSSGVASVGLDTPATAHAFMTVINAHGKCMRTARAKFAAWKSRVVRGLWVDSFGAQAEALRSNLLQAYDRETIMASGLPQVANYRLELRTELQSMMDSTLTSLFDGQIENCEKSILKKLNAQLLKTVNNDNVEETMEVNTVAMREEAFHFEKIATDLQVPTLGLTKEKAVREMSVKLNDALMTFPDSPAAKLKRTKKVKTVVNKEKKPGQRSVDLGLDLVAVLRPDGFGSLQGFCGYQLGGNSITLGIHNDADDPQTIAQFGGVRPPLLKVQPKLRVDVEL